LRPIAGRIARVVDPIGGYLDAAVTAGGELPVTFVWRVAGRPPAGEYQMLAHLIDHRAQKVSGQDALGYPPAEWHVGDVVWSRFRLPVPADLPPGRYQAQVAWYDVRSGARLPVEDSTTGGPAFAVGEVRVLAALPAHPPDRPIGARFGSDPAIELIGSEPLLRASDSLAVTLQWRAAEPPRADFTVFVQLLDEAGRLVAQSDSYPRGGALPTSAWLPGETVRDTHRLTLPPDLPPGRYRLIAGLYQLPTGQRLPLPDGGDTAEIDVVSWP
ncbi:MAG TPA: hypothetical protein VHL09_04955, partial [Dehalococcoidia bacterium]|nr:hypothetical protein [Dehalococcoidia bacterium]